jgi:predicted ATP-grasp superfamily ATP-dependent carboligase
VIGLSAERRGYGNFSRYARTVRCADSRTEPETLLHQLTELGQALGQRAVLFPTRDHDLVLLDRFRSELEPQFSLVIPNSDALERSLNKWQTYLMAQKAGVDTARSWLVDDAAELRRVAAEIRFPCVLKPVAAHHWRAAGNWALVGGRKAVSIASRDLLLAEYAVLARADCRVLVQEQIAGDDDCLLIAACYVDRNGTFRSGFNTQKVVQTPPGFGTGCIVQSADRPELFDRTTRLLRAMDFTGIAEVEYKWDAASSDYKLIEVNPRAWDQHRLGSAAGVDLTYLAYCDHAALPMPEMPRRVTAQKWVAEDALLFAVLRLLWHREPGIRALLGHLRGRKQYGIWSWRDPLPFVVYAATLIPNLIGLGLQAVRRLLAPSAIRAKIAAWGAH